MIEENKEWSKKRNRKGRNEIGKEGRIEGRKAMKLKYAIVTCYLNKCLV